MVKGTIIGSARISRPGPGMDWAQFLSAAGLGKQADFVVWQPSAVTGIAELVGAASLNDWRAYLSFHAVEHLARFLPQALVVEDFHFYGTVLEGTPELSARWKRGVTATSVALGDAVGKLYVAQYFPPEAKAQITALVDALLKAFSKRIDHLDWMSSLTPAPARSSSGQSRVPACGVSASRMMRCNSGASSSRSIAR